MRVRIRVELNEAAKDRSGQVERAGSRCPLAKPPAVYPSGYERLSEHLVSTSHAVWALIKITINSR